MTPMLVTSLPPPHSHWALFSCCKQLQLVNAGMTLPGFLQTPGRMIFEPYSLPVSKWSRSGILVIDCDRRDYSTIDPDHDRNRAQPYCGVHLYPLFGLFSIHTSGEILQEREKFRWLWIKVSFTNISIHLLISKISFIYATSLTDKLSGLHDILVCAKCH